MGKNERGMIGVMPCGCPTTATRTHHRANCPLNGTITSAGNPTEPTTAAGRRWAANPDWWLIEGERQRARECIAAIEREAREQGKERATAGDAAFLDELTADWEQKCSEAIAAALERVRERVEKAEPKYGPMRAPEWYFDGWYEAQDTVLTIIEEEMNARPKRK